MKLSKFVPSPGHFASLLTASLLALPNAMAQDRDWWFEVEVLVYKRDVAAEQMAEQFARQLNPSPFEQGMTLLGNYLHPDVSLLAAALPQCEPNIEPLPAVEEIIQQYAISQTKLAMLASLKPILEQQLRSPFPTAEPEQQEPLWSLVEQTATALSEVPLPLVSPEPDPDAESEQEQESLAEIAPLMAEAQTEIPSLPGADTEQVMQQPAQPDPVELWNEQVGQAVNELHALLLQSAMEPAVPSYPLLCASEAMTKAWPDQYWLNDSIQWPSVPVRIDGTNWLYSDSAYLLPKSELRLGKLFRDITRKQGNQPLLHVGWRQEVLFGRDKAPDLHLIAGKNFASEFTADGTVRMTPAQLPEQDIEPQTGQMPLAGDDSNQQQLALQLPQQLDDNDLLKRIRVALEDPRPELDPGLLITEQSAETEQNLSEELWELDGRFKVYLQYINRVPYLHIDSALDFRQPRYLTDNRAAENGMDLQTSEINTNPARANNFLQSYGFEQLRRVISTQVHYFDHPLFGIVVQIRRHTRPEPPEPEEVELDDSEFDTGSSI